MSHWKCGRQGLSTWTVLLQHKRSGFDEILAVEGLLPAKGQWMLTQDAEHRCTACVWFPMTSGEKSSSSPPNKTWVGGCMHSDEFPIQGHHPLPRLLTHPLPCQQMLLSFTPSSHIPGFLSSQNHFFWPCWTSVFTGPSLG